MGQELARSLLTRDIPLLLLVVGGVVGVRVAPDPNAAWPLFVAILWAALLYVASALASRHTRLARSLLVGVVGIAFACAVAFLLCSPGEAYPDKVGIITRLRAAIGGLLPTPLSWAPFPASVAMLLEGPVMVAAVFATTSRTRAAKRWNVFAALVIGLAILVTESRGAWIAVLSASAVALTWRQPRVRLPVLTATIVIALMLAPAARGPVHQWALALAGDSPWLGVGLRGFEFSLSRYVLLIQVPFLSYAHSLFLDAWLQLGLPGLVACLWIAASTVAAIVAAPPRPSREVVWWRAACDLGVLATLLHGLTDARPFLDPWSGSLVFVMLGAGRGLSSPRIPRQESTGLYPSTSQGTSSEHFAARLASNPCVAPAVSIAAAVIALAWAGSPVAAFHTSVGAVTQARADWRLLHAAPPGGPASSTARRELEQALGTAPEFGPAHFRLGLMLLGDESFDDARTHLAAALRAMPGRPGVRKALGLAAVWTGDVGYAAELLATQSDAVDELNTWAVYRAGRGQRALAINAYQTSLRLSPGQPHVRDALRTLTVDDIPLRP